MLDLNKIFQSKFFTGCICGLAIFIILSLTFASGMAVGFRKADFSYRFGDNYHKNFAGPGPGQGMMRQANGGDYIDGHGIIGQVIKINQSSIVIKDGDNIEKIILVDKNTQVNRMRDSIKITDLKVDDTLVVIGEPDQTGNIMAKLIRVMPVPPVGNQPQPLPTQSAASATTTK